jgi:hypothetical protein
LTAKLQINGLQDHTADKISGFEKVVRISGFAYLIYQSTGYRFFKA